MYWFKPWESPTALLISAIWLIIGLLFLTYSFLYPHYYLGKVVKNERTTQLIKIQKIISEYETRIFKLTDDDFKNLREYSVIYKQISKSKESSIDTNAIIGFVSTLIFPTLSFLGGIFNLKQLVAKLLGI